MSYPGGPLCWSNTTQAGAYGWTALVTSAATDKECTAPETSGAWLPPQGLNPISLRQDGEGLSSCFLACNISEVARTGVDPCNAASISNSSAPFLGGVFATYSCYYGGQGWIHPDDVGVCGFNCSQHVHPLRATRPCDGWSQRQRGADTSRCERTSPPCCCAPADASALYRRPSRNQTRSE